MQKEKVSCLKLTILCLCLKISEIFSKIFKGKTKINEATDSAQHLVSKHKQLLIITKRLLGIIHISSSVFKNKVYFSFEVVLKVVLFA